MKQLQYSLFTFFCKIHSIIELEAVAAAIAEIVVDWLAQTENF